MLKKIAITGNLGTGKSETLKVFKKLGAYTIDADKITHDLLSHDEETRTEILKLLGNTILEKGKIDRKKIAKIVFSDENKLKKLEKAIHPKIINVIEKEYENIKNKNFIFFVVEMPLLFETTTGKYFDITILITAKDLIAKKRYKDKDYYLRKKRQTSEEEKEKLSDFVIKNNQTLSYLEENIKKISKIIKNL